jgi:hypothetical protein
MKTLILIFVLHHFVLANGYCQRHNGHWISGSVGNPVDFHERFGGNILNWVEDSLSMNKEFRPMNFVEAMGVGSDSSGALLFYTNGMYIANMEQDTMSGGGPMNPGYWADEWTSWGDYGYRTRDGIIVLPDLELPDHYRLFHVCASDDSLYPDKLMTTRINMAGDGGLGEVVEQNVVVYDLQYGRLSQSHFNATRHANGRDWWLVSSLYPSEGLLLHLYTPDTIYRYPPQAPLWSKASGVGQCQFSPDGTKFATSHVRRFTSPQGTVDEPSLHYYIFDRCTGNVTPVFYDLQNDVVSQNGLIFSANSRYLYQTYQEYIFRYDTEAPDVLASKDTVAEWDGYISYTPGGAGFKVRFGYGELGADNVVYSNSSSTTFYMHRVDQADSEDDYAVTQHFKVPAIYAWTVPNFPNYQLGPMAGSPCAEMFGPPTALFEYMQEGPSLAFEDFSAGVPLTWHWDFGDGTSSGEQHPQHSFLSSGTYTVCLTAANIYGGDTQCKEILVETSNIQKPHAGMTPSIHPNPARDRVDIRLPAGDGQVRLYDAAGRMAGESSMHDGAATLSLQGMPPGVYTIHLRLNDGREWRESLVVH